MPTHRVFGTVTRSDSPGGVTDVGLFAGSRMDAEPMAWQRTVDGRFSLAVPEGTYFLHATSGILHASDFFEALEWGSYGGVYGFGVPLCVDHDIGPLQVTVSSLERDLLHIPKHRQLPVSEIQAEWTRQVERLLLQDPSLSIAQVSEHLSINRVYLAATFKRARGLTIEEYRTCVRIETAKLLLVQTEEPLIAIAAEVGYESLSQLNRVFQQFVGVTPGRFRDFAQQMRKIGDISPDAISTIETAKKARSLSVRFLDRITGIMCGTVRYEGGQRGKIIYVGAFRTPTPSSYPVGWTSIPKPGDFTLRCFFSGPVYIMACYCGKPMRYPGDMRSSFADGVHGQFRPLRYGESTDGPTLSIQRGAKVDGIIVRLFDNGTAARHSSPWTNIFMPDGR